ncbi:Phage major capsid protein E [Cohaesibacter sp. ES.047]|uniref:major capsid protein n=1 Tax=Cohaesibacter sp. ES.047 TaxID=1798205 RepID=UPI000BB9A0B3|nr:major capsid protein [Cohaesibacter sp. ES.047]SNY94067.1 Phage major capsid protein E [Cohaesibacter sp. ES.047]
MVAMTIFSDDAFRTMELTEALNETEYVPQFLDSLGIFEEESITGRDFGVERVGQSLNLIPTSALGAPPRQTERDPRKITTFKTTRLADAFTLFAFEIEGIRDDGPDGGLLNTLTEFDKRNRVILDNMDLTKEFHRLGALQGKLLDADGTTVIYDYFSELGVAEPAAVDFGLNDETTNVRQVCTDIKRQMTRGSKGAITSGTQIHSLAGDEFFDTLVNHASVSETYKARQGEQLRENMAFETFYYGGIFFHNYRGTDDNSSVAIASDEVKVFPVGANGVFKKVTSPAEFGPWVNTYGEDRYGLMVEDRDRQAWVKGEVYSYPLFLCAKPYCLRSGVLAS